MVNADVSKGVGQPQASGQWTAGQKALLQQILRFRRDRIVESAAARPVQLEGEDEAYAMQDALAARLRRKLAGWKVGAYYDTSVQRALGLSQPFYGRVFAADLRRSPAVLKPAKYPACHVEAELALEIAEDIPAGSAPVDIGGMAKLVAGVLPVFEVVTSTWDNRNLLSGLDHVADNGGCGGLVAGKPIKAWAEIDLRQQHVQLRVDGQLAVERQIAVGWQEVLGAAAWLVNRLKARGVGIEAGQIIAAGTLTGLTPVGSGQTAEAYFGHFGKVRMSIAHA